MEAQSLSNGGASGPSSVEQYKHKACASKASRTFWLFGAWSRDSEESRLGNWCCYWSGVRGPQLGVRSPVSGIVIATGSIIIALSSYVPIARISSYVQISDEHNCSKLYPQPEEGLADLLRKCTTRREKGKTSCSSQNGYSRWLYFLVPSPWVAWPPRVLL